MRRMMMIVALSALRLSAGTVSISVTDVRINGSQNTLYPQYTISGEDLPECPGLRATVYDVSRTTKYGETMFDGVTAGSQSLPLYLGGWGLNADDCEDGKPAIYIELSVIDTCAITEDGPLVLASAGIAYPDSGSSSSSGLSRHYRKTQTLTGVVWDGDDVSVLSIKTGKINNKGHVTVSGSILRMNGKKLSMKSVKLKVDGNEQLHGTLKVKNGTTIDITIDEDEMWGAWKGVAFRSGSDDVGGSFEKGRVLTFYFLDFIDATADAFPAGTVLSLLPHYYDGISVKKGKMAFPRAASVRWTKPKTGAAQPEIYDSASGKGLIVDTSNGRTNLSGLKLAYTPKTGLFKGSFKIYTVQNKKLKKITSKATGIVVNSTGYGQAAIKGKPSLFFEID